MMTIQEKEKELIEEFDMFDDWMEKYTYIIDMGKHVCNTIDIKNQENLVAGCNSQVWLDSRFEDGKVFFRTDSDALLPKGIAQMLVRIYSGNSPQKIIEHDPVFIKEIGLEEHLSPNRANGLVSMLNKIKAIAKTYINSI